MMPEKMDLMKRTASAEMQQNFEKVINEIPLRVETARLATALFFVDNDYVKVWNKKLDSYQEKLPPRARQLFLAHLNNQYSKLITEKIDPTSRVFVRSYNPGKKHRSWFLKWPQCIISNFKEVGTYGCIEGVPRSGKTSLGCVFMKMFYEDFGIETLTNIKINNEPEYVHYVQKLSDLVQEMNDLKRWICILDETATFADKKVALSKGNIDFENLARFIGKMGGRLLMITHSYERDIPTRLQDWMTERYKKVDKTILHCYNSGKLYTGNEKIKDVPDTDFYFLTEDITSLQFDISIKQLLQDIQDNISVERALRMQKKPITTYEKVVDYRKRHKNISQKEIAKVFGISQATVCEHLQNYKKRKGKK
jgi:predicted XRE-type DNA-binding protein